MRSILFFICLIFTFEGQAQEVEKSHMWKVELSGALNNNSAWEVEPSVTYLPIPYVGITMGLLFCNTIEKDSYTGFSRDNQWFWDSDESNPGCHFFALRPAIQLVTKSMLSLDIDQRYIFSLGYIFSNFDLYSGGRNFIVEGKRLSMPRIRFMHSFFLSIGYRF